MIKVTSHPTGGKCASALVLNPKTREVYTDWAVFTGNTQQVKTQFRQYIASNGLVLINN